MPERPLNREFPEDVRRALGTWVPTVPGARRAWDVWLSHPRKPGEERPVLVIDAGLVTGGLRITVDDPKQIARRAELEFRGPVGIPTFVGCDPREIAAIVGDRAPFWGD